MGNNMSEIYATIEGNKIYRSDITDPVMLNHPDITRLCAITEHEIPRGEPVTLLITNCHMFPNVWVTTKYLDEEYYDPRATCMSISHRYHQFMAEYKKKDIWIGGQSE